MTLDEIKAWHENTCTEYGYEPRTALQSAACIELLIAEVERLRNKEPPHCQTCECGAPR